MKLIIAEYLRTLRERDELDRLLPDLLVEMGYKLVARPQTGNRQYGVDIAARGENDDGQEELLLLVVKRGDIGSSEWDTKPQSVRQSINEIFDVYLRSHLEPRDEELPKHIVLVTNGELKQTVLANWCGLVSEYEDKAKIEFWGIDTISSYVEEYLLDEHVFHDDDRHDLRRALALSGDSEYNRKDLHRIFRRALDLDEKGNLTEESKTGKNLLKAMRIVNLSAQIYANWSLLKDGDSRQGLLALERALLWSWHRIQLTDSNKDVVKGPFTSIWSSYTRYIPEYFSRLMPYYFTPNSLSRSPTYGGAETSLVAFEQIGFLASFAVFMALQPISPNQDSEREYWFQQLNSACDALVAFIDNNGICTSPCLDSHSQDITLALFALMLAGRIEFAQGWLKRLFRNIDYSYKSKNYVPIAIESLEDLPDEGGWLGDHASKRMMEMSWTLATIAGWCVILDLEDVYKALVEGATQDYPNTCIQLWHPEDDFYQHLYFRPAHFVSGVSQAPIELPPSIEEYKKQMMQILESDFAKAISGSPAVKSRLLGLDFIAFRHFSTPVPPATWYGILRQENDLDS
ncbi:hypothetical protein [Lacimicrobium alkaliphilum]|uniref:Uncharacterized protein n=1 Tax=Lacimicrobium alkaliphilum TaxID=1526571 RepID=A0A0U3BB97_9ALTE|nr:hypothetical protein [Lacimicrobium alkaliphilum]ALS98917.1 hypothetical protein AT746_11970 [Lacimicrobium alkaliphilum]